MAPDNVINIGSGNGLSPHSNKPLHEANLPYHYYGSVAFACNVKNIV